MGSLLNDSTLLPFEDMKPIRIVMLQKGSTTVLSNNHSLCVVISQKHILLFQKSVVESTEVKKGKNKKIP